jgi:four helix bundle protein
LQWLLAVARHFSELICWQLAQQLRQEAFELSSRASFNQNFKLRGQLQSAASSASSNISEGFGRLTHREFHRFLEVSRSSVNEVEDRLGEAVEDRRLNNADIVRALNLCKRTRVATSRLMKWLKNHPDPERNLWRRAPRSRTRRPPRP